MGLFSLANANQQEMALRRYEALSLVHLVVSEGAKIMDAREAVAARLSGAGFDLSTASLSRWQRAVAGLPRHQWLDALTSGYVGRTSTAEIPDGAWAVFIASLESGARSYAAAYAQTVAAFPGELACQKTFERRLKSLYPDFKARFRGLRKQG